MKVYIRSRLLDKGAEINEFEIMIGNRYGSSKHSFNLDEINDQLVMFG